MLPAATETVDAEVVAAAPEGVAQPEHAPVNAEVTTEVADPKASAPKSPPPPQAAPVTETPAGGSEAAEVEEVTPVEPEKANAERSAPVTPGVMSEVSEAKAGGQNTAPVSPPKAAAVSPPKAAPVSPPKAAPVPPPPVKAVEGTRTKMQPPRPPAPWQRTPVKAMPDTQGPILAHGSLSARRSVYGREAGVAMYPWVKEIKETRTEGTQTLLSIHPSVILGPAPEGQILEPTRESQVRQDTAAKKAETVECKDTADKKAETVECKVEEKDLESPPRPRSSGKRKRGKVHKDKKSKNDQKQKKSKKKHHKKAKSKKHLRTTSSSSTMSTSSS